MIYLLSLHKGVVASSVVKSLSVMSRDYDTGEKKKNKITLQLIQPSETDIPQDMLPMKHCLLCFSPSKPFPANEEFHIIIGILLTPL